MNQREILELAEDGLHSSIESIKAHFEKSHGQPTMYPEDTKLALLHTMFALEDLERMLIRLNRQPAEEPKKFWQFWK